MLSIKFRPRNHAELTPPHGPPTRALAFVIAQQFTPSLREEDRRHFSRGMTSLKRAKVRCTANGQATLRPLNVLRNVSVCGY